MKANKKSKSCNISTMQSILIPLGIREYEHLNKNARPEKDARKIIMFVSHIPIAFSTSKYSSYKKYMYAYLSTYKKNSFENNGYSHFCHLFNLYSFQLVSKTRYVYSTTWYVCNKILLYFHLKRIHSIQLNTTILMLRNSNSSIKMFHMIRKHQSNYKFINELFIRYSLIMRQTNFLKYSLVVNSTAREQTQFMSQLMEN